MVQFLKVPVNGTFTPELFFFMSFCKIVPAVLGLPAAIERQVSSASELILDWISSSISLM